ncbi:hypothetical protein EON65_53530 [archaeon]|nr:MAG: hypothetical protein EON65_53530 [archaeon]
MDFPFDLLLGLLDAKFALCMEDKYLFFSFSTHRIQTQHSIVLNTLVQRNNTYSTGLYRGFRSSTMMRCGGSRGLDKGKKKGVSNFFFFILIK